MRFRKIVVQRVTVVKFRVDNRGSDGTGCFRIEVRMDTAELSDIRVASFLYTASMFSHQIRYDPGYSDDSLILLGY